MGNWTITVKGHGIHHNDLPGDADRLGQKLVEGLRAAGSEVESATLKLEPAGEVTDLLVPNPRPTRPE